jgi:predicted nucleic acid-binding protein
VTILDASSVINLINGGVLAAILDLPNHKFAIGPQVMLECAGDQDFIRMHMGNTLSEMSDEQIPASLFFALLEEHGLGLGETECLVLAIEHNGSVCTDDRKARKMCAAALGRERVLGTVRLLRESVAADILSADDAIVAYETMRSNGAFLPEIPQDYFRPTD